MGTVRAVTQMIEDRDKPGLRNTSEHRGFCLALEAVRKEIGEATVGDNDGFALPICPDCGTTMQKLKGTNSAGVDLIVWRCACEVPVPDPADPEPGTAGDPTPPTTTTSGGDENES